MFVKKCNQDIQSFLVNKNVTWPDIENTMIAPFLMISEDPSLDDDQKSAALTDIGLSGGSLGAYGISKACVNAYTLELAKRFPMILANSCSPGFY